MTDMMEKTEIQQQTQSATDGHISSCGYLSLPLSLCTAVLLKYLHPIVNVVITITAMDCKFQHH